MMLHTTPKESRASRFKKSFLTARELRVTTLDEVVAERFTKQELALMRRQVLIRILLLRQTEFEAHSQESNAGSSLRFRLIHK
jgi:hypothetical protein